MVGTRLIAIAHVGVFSATQVFAGCPQGTEAFNTCQIEGRNTEVAVCFDDRNVSYSYGSIGSPPELELSSPVERVDFEPWPGLGRSIYEEVTFYNGDYSYTVGGGFERPFSDEEAQQELRRFGWVEVMHLGEQIAYFECRPETVTYGFGGGLYDLKVAANQSWDQYSLSWVSDLVQPTSSSTLRDTNLETCLSPSEFSLGGLRLGDPLSMLGKLGSPEPVQGSGIPIDRLTLVDMTIDIFEDEIVAMSSELPTWATRSGLKVGLTRGEVIRLLGRVPLGYDPTADSFSIDACSDQQGVRSEWMIDIDFGQDKRVSRITLAMFSP
ncbi:hypothetical protein QQG91_15160 (plasmid) [Marivivens sp. LCG002]|uniref:hypothetical protein n=1 Tax=Marivivens sp. LCG002 TaxID=3051171 RepID=UPI002555FDFB|nr:hypothetical protein [Marivivens sp. LCG002]WIV52320.1 hypothetical protein QQG91_15160 [Marivivens sp. LCG002]